MPRLVQARWSRPRGPRAFVAGGAALTVAAGATLVALVEVVLGARRRGRGERRAAEQANAALAASEQRYRELFEHANDILYTLDAEGRLTEINRRGEIISGYSSGELIGRSLLELVLPEYHEPMRAMFARKVEGTPRTVYELEIRAKDGRIVPLEVNSRLVEREGRPAGVQGIARDISERRRADAEQQRRRDQEAAAQAAAEADRLKTELLSTVSHELRTPLAAIKGFTTMLLTYGEQVSAAERADILRDVDASTDRLTELVDHLLDLTRLESGVLRMERAPVALGQVLSTTVTEMVHRFPERTITLLAGPLPPVVGDARRLRQVMSNLIDNAVKYSPAGGAIDVRAHALTSGEAEFSVTDRGIGISPEVQGQIFDRFYRVRSEQTQAIGGSGLGLAICRRIVEAHGGTITVTSREGEGSTFVVRLPAAPGVE